MSYPSLIDDVIHRRLDPEAAESLIDELRREFLKANACSVCGVQYTGDYTSHDRAKHEEWRRARGW